ncbi:hypothetical protein BIV57_07010 [Mangrovactinospora gilvigrisea]|uniref:HTTM-like domain-containing protein n=1 Tax=Mangrovactinospora gilvigrisea TaxID=1428644 RepID=A0A1J7C9I7_9ACTN|nr:HTTM domain-containing protein [Mangrovactinospora gilvigrisea]OIV38188.1 hypothetical protein BIV57_07010 [Mangrovactinospora gilvigrisea]
MRRLVDRFTGTVLAPYQAAVVRIGFGGLFALFLVREWPNRLALYGDRSPWGLDLVRRQATLDHLFTLLVWSGSRFWFELVYTAAVAAAVLLALGWHTRAVSVLFLVGVLSVQNRSLYTGDGGDNVVHLMAIYLVFARCGRVWSLDARRRRAALRRDPETADAPGGTAVGLWAGCGLALAAAQLSGFGARTPGAWAVVLWALWAVHGAWGILNRSARGRGSEARAVCDGIATMAHNCAMGVIAAQVCLVYATAGWYKIQGDKWQDGTAVYYVLHLDYFRPWPALDSLLAGSSFALLAIAYGSVAMQVAFPFTVFQRRLKNVLLPLMIAEHLGIAVVLGLPFFSATMIVADALFLPTAWLRRLGAAFGRATARRRAPAPAARPAEALTLKG